MNEVKQLLMNRFFKKMLLFVFILISSFVLVFLNHDKWIEYKSWVQLFLWVVLLQVSLFGLIKLAVWIPWKKVCMSIYSRFFEKSSDPVLDNDIECMKNDLMQVIFRLGGRKYPYYSMFFKNKIKLPFYICFESTFGLAEHAIKESAYEEVPMKNSSDKIKVILSEQAVFCILSSALLNEQGKRWLSLLRIARHYFVNFSSISALIFVKNKEDTFDDLGRWLQMCRLKVEEMTKSWNRFVPSYGISYQSMELPDFDKFVKDDKGWGKEILKLNIFEFPGNSKKENLIHFFQAIFKKWTLYRFFSIEKLNKISDKWEKFIFPDRQTEFFDQLSVEWGKFIQDAPFNQSTSMHSLYFVESHDSQKMIWQDLMKNTIDLENRKIMSGAVHFSTMMKVNMYILIMGFLIFSILNVSHVCRVSALVSLDKGLGENRNMGSLAQTYNQHVLLGSRSLEYGGIFSLFGHNSWVQSQNNLFKTIQESLSRMEILLEKSLVDTEKSISENRGSLKTNDNYMACYEALKVLLTLLNQSPETPVQQISLILSWMENQNIIDKKEVPEMSVMMTDYFKKNDSKWLVESSQQKPIIQKVRGKLNSLSPVKSFLAQLEIIEKRLAWGSVDRIEIFPQGNMDLIQIKYVMPKLYTADGWKQMVEPLMQSFIDDAQRDDWVLGYQENPHERGKEYSSTLLEQVLEKAYFREYEKHWEKFFKNIYVRPFLNTNDASVKLGVLLDPEGAWTQLFRFITENMHPLLVTKGSALQQIRVFLSVHRSDENNNAHDNYEGYLEDLRNVRAELEGLVLNFDQGRAIEQYLRGLFVQSEKDRNAVSNIAHKLAKIQRPGYSQIQKNFYKVLVDPVLKVFSVISKDGLLNIEKDWRLEVANPFNTDLSQKFPFNNVEQEVALADFVHFFNPKKGKIAQFMEARVHCFIQESRGRMVPKRWMGETIPISSRFFSGIERAGIFSQGLFNQKSGEIEIKLQLFPEPSPYFSEFSIEVNGASHSYQNDPEEWKLLNWPGQYSYPKSTFSATAINPPFKFFETLSGEWSFFRLLKQYANWNKISPGNYRVSFKFRTDKKDDVDNNIVFKLKTDTTIDIFRMIEMNRFEMVDRVYGQS